MAAMFGFGSLRHQEKLIGKLGDQIRRKPARACVDKARISRNRPLRGAAIAQYATVRPGVAL